MAVSHNMFSIEIICYHTQIFLYICLTNEVFEKPVLKETQSIKLVRIGSLSKTMLRTFFRATLWYICMDRCTNNKGKPYILKRMQRNAMFIGASTFFRKYASCYWNVTDRIYDRRQKKDVLKRAKRNSYIY